MFNCTRQFHNSIKFSKLCLINELLRYYGYIHNYTDVKLQNLLPESPTRTQDRSRFVYIVFGSDLYYFEQGFIGMTKQWLL